MGFATVGYGDIIDALASLQALLRGGGLSDPELNRLQAHASRVQKIEALRLSGEIDKADRDKTLWALVESSEFADIYHAMSTYSPRLLAEKFKLILKGPEHPNDETESTNLARNTAFELSLASRLQSQGFEISLPHNPDIICKLQDSEVFIQCKRPFYTHNIRRNITRAAQQLTCDLDSASGRNVRGVIAVSISRVANSRSQLFRGASRKDISAGLTSEIQKLVEPYPWNSVKDHRIIGSVFHIITPGVIEDLGNLLSTIQQMVVYPAPSCSEADRDILRVMFMKDDTPPMVRAMRSIQG